MKAPDFDEIAWALHDAVKHLYDREIIWLAHNARSTEMHSWHGLVEIYGFPVVTDQWIDTQDVSTRAYPFLENQKLSTVAAHLGYENTEQHHHAQWDAKVSLDIAHLGPAKRSDVIVGPPNFDQKKWDKIALLRSQLR